MQMYAKDDIMKKLVDKAVVGLPPAVATLAKTIAAKARRNGYSLKGVRTSQLDEGTLNSLSLSHFICPVRCVCLCGCLCGCPHLYLSFSLLLSRLLGSPNGPEIKRAQVIIVHSCFACS